MNPNSEAVLTIRQLREVSAFLRESGHHTFAQFLGNAVECVSALASHESKRPPATTAEAVKWEFGGDKQCRYTNWLGHTPFGRILITWKGWKEGPDASVDEFPGGFDLYGRPDDLKAACEAEYMRRLGTHPAPSTTVAAGEASERFVPIGACTCAGPDGPCESCIANREAYEEWLAERSTPPTDPKADLLRMMAEVLERARHYVVKASSTGPISASLLTDIDQLLQEARQ